MGPEEHGGHCELEFDGLEIPDENRLMGVGDGLKVTQIRLGTARLTHCMRWLGLAKRCMEIAQAYVDAREGFGIRLADRECVQLMLGGVALNIQIGRLLTMNAAWALDQGSHARKEVSMAKLHVADTLHQAADTAIQLNGARGYSTRHGAGMDLPLCPPGAAGRRCVRGAPDGAGRRLCARGGRFLGLGRMSLLRQPRAGRLAGARAGPARRTGHRRRQAVRRRDPGELGGDGRRRRHHPPPGDPPRRARDHRRQPKPRRGIRPDRRRASRGRPGAAAPGVLRRPGGHRRALCGDGLGGRHRLWPQGGARHDPGR